MNDVDESVNCLLEIEAGEHNTQTEITSDVKPVHGSIPNHKTSPETVVQNPNDGLAHTIWNKEKLYTTFGWLSAEGIKITHQIKEFIIPLWERIPHRKLINSTKAYLRLIWEFLTLDSHRMFYVILCVVGIMTLYIHYQFHANVQRMIVAHQEQEVEQVRIVKMLHKLPLDRRKTEPNEEDVVRPVLGDSKSEVSPMEELDAKMANLHPVEVEFIGPKNKESVTTTPRPLPVSAYLRKKYYMYTVHCSLHSLPLFK